MDTSLQVQNRKANRLQHTNGLVELNNVLYIKTLRTGLVSYQPHPNAHGSNHTALTPERSRFARASFSPHLGRQATLTGNSATHSARPLSIQQQKAINFSHISQSTQSVDSTTRNPCLSPINLLKRKTLSSCPLFNNNTSQRATA